MTRRERTEILIRGKRELAVRLATEIEEKYGAQKIEAANEGLVMVKMREPAKRTLFYLGEVTVTEAKVAVHGKIGMGLVVGKDEELAYNLAVIDAAYQAELPETNGWREMLLAEQVAVGIEDKREMGRIMKTKVDFSNMQI